MSEIQEFAAYMGCLVLMIAFIMYAARASDRKLRDYKQKLDRELIEYAEKLDRELIEYAAECAKETEDYAAGLKLKLKLKISNDLQDYSGNNN